MNASSKVVKRDSMNGELARRKRKGIFTLVGQRSVERSTCAHGAKVDYLVAESCTALSQFFNAFGLNSSIE